MATDTDLVNIALGLVGQDGVPSLDDTIQSKTISIARRFLPVAKEDTLRARDWNAARGRAALNAVANESEDEWLYAYRLPSDCLCVRRFSSPYPETKHAAFSVENDSDGKPILYTSDGCNKIVYTKNLTDVNRWDAWLRNACALRLAWYFTGPFVRDYRLQQVKLQELDAMFTEAVGVDEAEGSTENVQGLDLITVRY